MVNVKKRKASNRIYADNRKLNKLMVDDPDPMTTIKQFISATGKELILFLD